LVEVPVVVGTHGAASTCKPHAVAPGP
jgi:hypothetical protein